jgi:hypothetical protein
MDLQFLKDQLNQELSKLSSSSFKKAPPSGFHLVNPEVIKLDRGHQADISKQEKLQRELNSILSKNPLRINLKDGAVLEVKAVEVVVTSKHNIYLTDISIGSIQNS